jgi:putative nucleotidyltransferase with HDIG domain
LRKEHGPGSLPIVAMLPILDELPAAQQICVDAKAAIGRLQDSARHGRRLDPSVLMPLVGRICDSVARHGVALISLARCRAAADYSCMHSLAVGAMMVALARKLRLDEAEVRAAGVAGLLHDIGKALVPRDVLDKPGLLTSAEFAAVRRHPEWGHRLLSGLDGVGPMSLDVCLHHHEKTDGSGYPHGLMADEISLYAKMAAVCDIYDALTSHRAYQGARDPADVLHQMDQWTATHLDPAVFRVFVRTVGIYPVGSVLLLKSGRIGIVADQAAVAPDLPQVQVVYCQKTGTSIAPELVNLAAGDCMDRIVDRASLSDRLLLDAQLPWAGPWNALP